MRTALVHYWLLDMRGGEKVLQALCKLLPDADIFTLFCDPERISDELRSRKIKTSFLNPLKRYHRHLLPLMPLALEHFDLRSYDLVISSESGPAKGVITSSHTRHVCYCHTPMRYLWELYPAYASEWTTNPLKRMLTPPLATALRLWDYSTAARVDEFIANSENTRKRIWKTYRRESQVIYPPVAVQDFWWDSPEDYFLIVSALVPYKRIDYAVRWFSASGRKLLIIGDGPEFTNLKKHAASNVQFCGRLPDQALREVFAKCRAFVLPGEEDFGIAAVEALASGKPVIALGKGGVLDSVTEGVAGIFYDEPSEPHLGEAIRRFEEQESSFKPDLIQSTAARFSETSFAEAMRGLIEAPGAGPAKAKAKA
jgi:glycosyltransferase involved in cell wall biosynthesis